MAMLRVMSPSRHTPISTAVLLGTIKLHFLHSSQPLQSAQHSCRHDKCTSSGSTPPTRIQLEASCMSHMTPHASMQTTLEIRWGANNSTPKGKHAKGGSSSRELRCSSTRSASTCASSSGVAPCSIRSAAEPSQNCPENATFRNLCTFCIVVLRNLYPV